MKSFAIAAVLSASAVLVTAQDAFMCPKANGTFCVGASLASPGIIHCTNSVPTNGSCSEMLAGIDPVGVKSNASCFQESAGNAVCSYNDMAYSDDSPHFPIHPIPFPAVTSITVTITPRDTAAPQPTVTYTYANSAGIVDMGAWASGFWISALMALFA